MDKRIDSIFTAYKTVLLAHIGTKTNEPFFHEKSAEFYDLLFKAFHTVSEKRQDTGADAPMECETAISDTVSALESALASIESMISEKNTVGTDNLLRGLADELESAIGSAKAFMEDEKYEDKPEAKKIKVPGR